MTLKRKRSETELCCSPSSSSSVFSSPPSNGLFEVDPQAFHNLPPAHIHSRTFKRHRDNRPSEELVHQHTLNLLYSAQQQPLEASWNIPQPNGQDFSTAQSTKQQSLHHFWSINSTPKAPQLHIHPPSTPLPYACDDCGGSLSDANNNDGMHLDEIAIQDTACGACGKHVCFSCSVSNLGEEKRCLQCAGRRIWVGSNGWAKAGRFTSCRN